MILAMAFPAAGGAYAQEANPRMAASITHDWFQAEEFSPGGTLNVKIYEEQGGSISWEENRTADESGFLVVEAWQHPVDLKPGNYLERFKQAEKPIEALVARLTAGSPLAAMLRQTQALPLASLLGSPDPRALYAHSLLPESVTTGN